MEKAIQTVTEMITQREYKITEKDSDKIIGVNSKGDRIIAFTNIISKFNNDRVKEYVSVLYKMGMNHCIAIYSDSITPMAKKFIKDSLDIKIELFCQDELQFNITKHRLVPPHIKLTDEEGKQFKKKYGLKHPVILTSDPVARFYNFKRGDIIKIVRPGGYITYRIVKG